MQWITQMVSLKQSHPVDTDTEATIVSVRINRFEFKENVRAMGQGQ